MCRPDQQVSPHSSGQKNEREACQQESAQHLNALSHTKRAQSKALSQRLPKTPLQGKYLEQLEVGKQGLKIFKLLI